MTLLIGIPVLHNVSQLYGAGLKMRDGLTCPGLNPREFTLFKSTLKKGVAIS